MASCAKQPVVLQHHCLPEPTLEAVIVRDGIIDRDNTPKVINNHIKAWEYIEYLKIKACK